MKLFIATLLIVAASAGRLDNSYLPPGNSHGDNAHRLSAISNHNLVPNSHHSDASYTDASTPNMIKPSETHNDNGHSTYPIVDVRQDVGDAENTDATAKILRFNNENNGDGSYNFEYETDNGIYHQESGELKNAGVEDDESIAVKGSYSYMGPDGIMYTVNYIADENGFRATGDHIPTAPPVPEAIQEALEKIAEQESDSTMHPEYSSNQVHPNYSTSNEHNTQHQHINNNIAANFNVHQQSGYPSANDNAAYPSFDNHKIQDNDAVAIDAATKSGHTHMEHAARNPSFNNQNAGYRY